MTSPDRHLGPGLEANATWPTGRRPVSASPARTRTVATLAERHGWDVVETYSENDTSAFKRRRITLPDGSTAQRVVRPEFRRMLADLAEGHIDALDTPPLRPNEELIVELLLDRLEQEADLQLAPPTDRTNELLAQVAFDGARLSALAEAFADDPDADPFELRAACPRIRARIRTTRSHIAQVTVISRVADPVAVRAAWLRGDYDLAQRRAVLALAIERVDVGPARPGNRFEPGRLSVTRRRPRCTRGRNVVPHC